MAQPDAPQPLRFSRPFFTTTKSRRKVIPGVGKCLAEYPSKAALLEKISDAMTADYNIANPKAAPTFLFHLGMSSTMTIPTGAISPPAAKTIYREMIAQPAVYWYLNTPFIDIVALYSNVADGPGYIADNNVIGQSQKQWLVTTLTSLAKHRKKGPRKTLLLAVHHPPFSGGGHGVQPVAHADGSQNGDHSFESSLEGYGYLTITADKSKVTVLFTQVNKDGTKQQYDKTIVVDLATNQIVPAGS